MAKQPRQIITARFGQYAELEPIKRIIAKPNQRVQILAINGWTDELFVAIDFADTNWGINKRNPFVGNGVDSGPNRIPPGEAVLLEMRVRPRGEFNPASWDPAHADPARLPCEAIYEYFIKCSWSRSGVSTGGYTVDPDLEVDNP